MQLSYSTLTSAFKTLKKKPIEEKRQLLKCLENKSVNFTKSKSKSSRFVSLRLRNYALKKANYHCQHSDCESTHFLQVDHIVPVRVGDHSEPENLQILCSTHNRMKG